MRLSFLIEGYTSKGEEACLVGNLTVKVGDWVEIDGWPLQVKWIHSRQYRGGDGYTEPVEYVIGSNDRNLPDANGIVWADRPDHHAPDDLTRMNTLHLEIEGPTSHEPEGVHDVDEFAGEGKVTFRPIPNIWEYAKQKNFQWDNKPYTRQW